MMKDIWVDVGLGCLLLLILVSNVSLLRKIKKFKQREKRNVDLLEQINQAQKMESVGRLAGGVAHDFNNMLAGINGAAEFLKVKMGDDNALTHYVDIILNACRKASNLTSQLLVFSRSKGITCENMDIHQCIRESIYLLEHGIDKKITIRQSLRAEKYHICGSYDLLQNMILNLGFNSRDAMPDGGTITVKTRNVQLQEKNIQKTTHKVMPGDYIELAFKDTGFGIPQDMIGKIFEPFFTTKDVGKGSGLGLPAVYGIVTENNGTILVKSSPKGTIFYVYLPIIKVKNISKAKEKKIKKLKAKILAVDDDVVLLELLKDILKHVGCEVVGTSHSNEAVAMYRKHQDIDIVMLDIIMPNKTGVEVYNEIKEINPDVKVMFMSGYNQDSKIEEIIKNSNNVTFINKPYFMPDVVDKLDKMLKKRSK